ncbi:hypothetical protein BVY03_02140 [bacterium K02(2017)]|nr:hypothetical protein BVY03_02140 [bacterium K02(2017)]
MLNKFSYKATLFFCCFGFLLFIFCFDSNVVYAWKAKRSVGISSKNPKPLSRMQHKNLSRRVVNKLLKHKFFKADLPRKIVISEMELEGNYLGVNQEEYTNHIVNRLLSHAKVMIMNQDLKSDLTMDYQLMHYLAPRKARRKGILLGANYYISGKLKSHQIEKEEGKMVMYYTAFLELRNIRNNKKLNHVSFEYKKSKNKKRRLKYR